MSLFLPAFPDAGGLLFVAIYADFIMAVNTLDIIFDSRRYSRIWIWCITNRIVLLVHYITYAMVYF